MKGTDGPTADNVYCVCPEPQALTQGSNTPPVCDYDLDRGCIKSEQGCQCTKMKLAQETPEKKKVEECVHVPSAKGCVERGTNKWCMCPDEAPEAPNYIKDLAKNKVPIVAEIKKDQNKH